MKRKIGISIFASSLLLFVTAIIWSIAYCFTHIDQTEVRQFIDNPYPTIMIIVGLFGLRIVSGLE